jgi:hypothetical protein
VLSHVDSLFLDDLLLAVARLARTETVSAIARVSPLLVEWLVSVSSTVLLDDEVGRSAHVGLS